MSTQEIFDKVVTHLRKQGGKARDYEGVCMYRTKTGLKCAAGCLIPDEEYDPRMEGKTSNRVQFFQNTFNYEERGLIERLQNIHDSRDVASWEEEWMDAATCHDVVYTPPVLP